MHVDHVELDDAVADLGTERAVEAVVSLGDLAPTTCEVQLLHGPAGQGEELADPQVVVLEQAGPADDGHLRYRGQLRVRAGGSLRHHRAHRPHPPDARHPRRARPHRLGLSGATRRGRRRRPGSAGGGGGGAWAAGGGGGDGVGGAPGGGGGA